MFKRTFLAVLTAASVAVGATVAEAAVKKGTYKGKMTDGAVVQLTVNKKQKLIKVYRKSVKFTCTDGDAFSSLADTAKGSVSVKSGKFDISDTDKGDAVTWRMTGSFKGSKVTGTYAEERTFNTQNELDPDGTVTCQTDSLTYRAALPKKR